MAAFPHAVLAERSFSQRFRDTFDVVTPEGHCISVLQRRPALELEAAEDELLSQNKTDALDTGCTVWDAAALLADFLMHSKYFDGFYYPNVLELGAGTGLVGLVAACCLDCDTILLTDLPRICEKVLRPNIVRNGFLQASLGRRVTCASLEWGRSPGQPRRHTGGANIKEHGSGTSTTSLRFLDDANWRPDLCLCADLVYTHEHTELLLATLADLFHQNPDLYVVWAQNGSHAPLAWREALLWLKKLYEYRSAQYLTIMGDDAVRYCAGCCCCGGLITAIVLIAISFSVLEATEMGLDYSSVSKSVSDEKLYPAGRHMLGVGHSFKKFPKDQQTVKFPGEKYRHLEARTYDGLEVLLDLNFQYRLVEDLSSVSRIYYDWGLRYDYAYVLVARNMLRDTAANWTAFEFFYNRTEIEAAMHMRWDQRCDIFRA
eukprot:g2223.t1